MLDFAAHEDRLSAQVLTHLANTQADFGGGLVTPGIFSKYPRDALGVAGHQPELLISSAIAVTAGGSVLIDGSHYTVDERREDGRGLQRLVLQAA